MAEGDCEVTSNIQEDCCVLCNLGFEDEKSVCVSHKGILTLINFGEKRGRLDLVTYLTESINKIPLKTVLVHKECRRNFTDIKRGFNSRVTDIEAPCAKRLRSNQLPFNWKEDCMLCGQFAILDSRYPETIIRSVTTLPMRTKLIECCAKRDDSWGSEVMNRLQGCIDLVAAEAVYHDNCLSRFLLNKEITKTPKYKAPGRHCDQEKMKWSEMLYQWLESEAGAEMYTLSELHAKMAEFADGSEIYSIKRFKQKLQEHYKDSIFFAEVGGRDNVICFKDLAKHIVNEKWYSDRKDSIEDEAERIVTAAAKLIKAGIREQRYDIGSYPCNEDIEDGKKWIPHLLQTFLKVIVTSSELKRTGIGHALVQAARPRSVITPTLFGLGVEMDHVFGSKWLINELSSLGFSISYDEVIRYKQSVIQSENQDNLLTEYLPGNFTQWVADNVDHNIMTLDGQGSFHGMGVIAISTPNTETSLTTKLQAVKRLQCIKVNQLVKDKGVQISSYFNSSKSLASVLFKPVMQLKFPYTLPSELYSDLLWHSGWMFSGTRPNWSGFMQHVFSSDHNVPNSEVLLLPIIDLNPSDETCIYSTLNYALSQARKLSIPSPCITFDQPLWIKAVEIIEAKSMNMVCRLGGFHTMMSFMGSIGTMMKGSGLEEALGNVYGPNAVTHMITGKAVSRALRGHFLIEAALTNKLLIKIWPDNETQGNIDCDGEIDIINKLDAIEAEKISDLYQGIRNKSLPLESIGRSKELHKLNECLLQYKALLCEKSPTAKLWLQYMEYVETLKLFIRAERTGNWILHLIAVERMINLFAATGHIHYAKSARLYLQMMLELPNDHPWLYKCFTEQGFHAVRRSNRHWAGLWTDLIIEQVMMRSIKSRGGLTRGRGITETVRLQWIYSMHRCAGIHDAMTTLTNTKHKTSEQHVDLSISRSNRDFKDLCKIQEWFDQHEPFNLNEGRLRSLSSGLTAAEGDGINCDSTEEVGAKIQMKLNNVSVTEASLKRKDQVCSLDHLQPGIQIDKKKYHIDPMNLFSRLIAIVQREEDMIPYFSYELTTIPTSLFKDSAMRKTQKSQLAKTIASGVELAERDVRIDHVIDGGALLHKVKWAKKATYKNIVMQYVEYVHAKYGQRCCIVFDGYERGPSTKDQEHLRRVGKTCADIQLSESMEALLNQQIFLCNERNKSQFIALLSHYLEADNQIVHQSAGDADTMIVACALQYATQGIEATVVADDTDVLVLLMYHWQKEMADVYFLSEMKTQKKLWNMRVISTKIGEVISSHILFIHAWSGCDTTSATFGQGKTTLLKKIKGSQEMQRISLLISDLNATQEEIGCAGIQLFIHLYGGKQTDSLNTLRYVKFMEMVSCGKLLEPERLPPTERAAFHHSLRVHHQVIVWAKLSENALDPKQWGWKLEEKTLTPIMTDLNPAPENLLNFIRCKCKISSRNPCGTNLCSCRKNGLKCVPACGDCRGETCNNSEDITMDLDDSDEEL